MSAACHACFSYPSLKPQFYWPESIFPLLNFQSGHKSFLRCWTPQDAFSLCGNSSAVPRGGVILTYGIEIPCGTDSYTVNLCSFSHLPPDPVLGCISITPPPWGRNPQPTLSSNPETTGDEKTFHSNNDAMFLSSAAAFWKQKIRRQSHHPQAEFAALQPSGTGANGPDADAREHTSYWHQGTTRTESIT